MTYAQASYARWWIARGMSVEWVVDTCPYGRPWCADSTAELKAYASSLKAAMREPPIPLDEHWKRLAYGLSKHRSAGE